MLIHHKYYGYLLMVSIVIIIVILASLMTACSRCPGSQNLIYPRNYDAIDLMKYDANEHCILSKTNTYLETSPHVFEATINEDDDFFFTMKANSLNYFRLIHYMDYESLREMYWKYMKYFKKYSPTYYKHDGRPSFIGDYLKWNFSVHLTNKNLQVTARVRELSIRRLE